ncbi:MAG: hypothetical protein LBQ90_08540 [Synergistaceae bacterium]|nr:hypothetical protein [Synergistaceae bacterium]
MRVKRPPAGDPGGVSTPWAALYTPCEAEEDGTILPALMALRFRGLNVTMPLRQKVIPCLDEPDGRSGARDGVERRGDDPGGAGSSGAWGVRSVNLNLNVNSSLPRKVFLC